MLQPKTYYQSTKDSSVYIYVTADVNQHGTFAKAPVIKHEKNKCVITKVIDRSSDWKKVKSSSVPKNVKSMMQKLADKYGFGKLKETKTFSEFMGK